MELLNHNARYLGPDGCRGGWITAVLDHGELHLERYQSLVEAPAAWPVFDAFLIDMVIGLRSNAAQLRPDDLAKKELGLRTSTAFPFPVVRQYAELLGESMPEEEEKHRLRMQI